MGDITLSGRLTLVFSLAYARVAMAQTPDAPASGLERVWADIEFGLYDLFNNPDSHELAYGIGFGLIALFGFILAFYVTHRMLQRAYTRLESWRKNRIPSLKIQSYELMSADRITDLLKRLARVIRIIGLADREGVRNDT